MVRRYASELPVPGSGRVAFGSDGSHLGRKEMFLSYIGGKSGRGGGGERGGGGGGGRVDNSTCSWVGSSLVLTVAILRGGKRFHQIWAERRGGGGGGRGLLL